MRSPKHPDSTPKPADRNNSPTLPEHGRTKTIAQAAAPPIIDPDAFERFEGFRETTLALFTDAEDNTTLRRMADFIYTLSLEYSRHWPDELEGYVHHQCRAVVADLRHLQGCLAMLGDLRQNQITTICGRLSPRVKKIADALEGALNSRPDED